MPFDPAADPVVNQTVQGVTANNLKTYGHFMDNIVHESAKDLLEEGRLSRSLSRQSGHALGARIVESILGSQMADAAADAVTADGAAVSVQQGAKIAQTTPPETAVVQALAQINMQLQAQAQQQQSFLLQLMAVLQQNPVGTATK